MAKKKDNPKNARRICIKCGRKKYIKHLVEVGTKDGRYFQADKEITLYKCKPNALNPELCR